MTTILTIGEMGSRDHEAAHRVTQLDSHLADARVVLLDGAVPDLFDKVTYDSDVIGLLPLQHSLHGVQPDLLRYWLTPERNEESLLQIKGVFNQPIRHHLTAGREAFTPDDLSVVVSDAPAYQRCSKRIADRYTFQVCPTMVDAVRMVARSRSSSMGALASSFAAERHDLAVLEEDVQGDHPDVMRYCVFGRAETTRAGSDVTAVLAWTSKRLGSAMTDLSSCVGQAGLDITNFQVLPQANRSMRVCYLEFSGHAKRQRVAKLVTDLRKVADRVSVLGSFPCYASN